MNRSRWKGPYVAEKNFKQNNTKAVVSRNTVILPKFVGKTFSVYNGKKYSEILVTEEMIGRKLGEFSATRERFVFKKKKTKN